MAAGDRHTRRGMPASTRQAVSSSSASWGFGLPAGEDGQDDHPREDDKSATWDCRSYITVGRREQGLSPWGMESWRLENS
ncbi:hypothetical protein ABZP36_000514 [Zizania latifolia]